MFAPFAVENGQQHPSLELSHDVLAELFLTPVVRGLSVGLEVIDERLAVEVVAFLILGAHQGHGIERVHIAPQLFEVPVLGKSFGCSNNVLLNHRVNGGPQP
jgi:hypothetical protein